MKNAIYILFLYHFTLRATVNYFDSVELYYFMDAALMIIIAAYVYVKSAYNTRNTLALCCIVLLALCQSFNTFITMIDSSNHIEYLPEVLLIAAAVDGLFEAYNNRVVVKDWFYKKLNL